jgi:hypothetical protein
MIGALIEILVCVLLATTIVWCVTLDRRLRKLKSDETTLRQTIVDLVAATEKAERAVGGLRAVVTDCDETIAHHLREAERHAADLIGHIRSGDDVIARISRIVESAGGRGAASAVPAATPAPAPAPAPVVPEATPSQARLAATVAAAQAFAERAHRRVNGRAA